MRRRKSLVVGMAVTATLVLAEATALAADPTTGDCLGASDASLKLGNEHKLRAERAQLLICASGTCPADIRKECESRVNDVNTQMPTVVFLAKDGAGADLSAVKITMDGDVLAERIEGSAIAVDPGEHTFIFETSGQAPVTEKLLLVEGQKERRETVTFGGAGASMTVAVSADKLTTADKTQGRGISSKQLAGFVVGGAGILGVGVGATLLALASSLSNRSDSEDEVRAGSGHADHEAALSDQTAAFVVGGLGVAAVGVGAYLIWTSSSPAGKPATSTFHASPEFGAHLAGLSFGGAF